MLEELAKQLKKNNMQKTAIIREDPLSGDLYFNLDEDVLTHLGWKEGDTLIWEDQGNDSWSIRKKDDTSVEQTE